MFVIYLSSSGIEDCCPIKTMADSFYKLEDEAFPSFLCKSLDSTSGRATLGNVTLGSGPGLPVAASTVAKIKPASETRWGGSLLLLLWTDVTCWFFFYFFFLIL